MTRNTCFASQIFWDKANHDRILVELHRFEEDDSQRYVFYKSKFATIRSRSAASDETIASAIHTFLNQLHSDAPNLAEEMDNWLNSKL